MNGQMLVSHLSGMADINTLLCWQQLSFGQCITLFAHIQTLGHTKLLTPAERIQLCRSAEKLRSPLMMTQRKGRLISLKTCYFSIPLSLQLFLASDDKSQQRETRRHFKVMRSSQGMKWVWTKIQRIIFPFKRAQTTSNVIINKVVLC